MREPLGHSIPVRTSAEEGGFVRRVAALCLGSEDGGGCLKSETGPHSKLRPGQATERPTHTHAPLGGTIRSPRLTRPLNHVWSQSSEKTKQPWLLSEAAHIPFILYGWCLEPQEQHPRHTCNRRKVTW